MRRDRVSSIDISATPYEAEGSYQYAMHVTFEERPGAYIAEAKIRDEDNAHYCHVINCRNSLRR